MQTSFESEAARATSYTASERFYELVKRIPLNTSNLSQEQITGFCVELWNLYERDPVTFLNKLVNSKLLVGKGRKLILAFYRFVDTKDMQGGNRQTLGNFPQGQTEAQYPFLKIAVLHQLLLRCIRNKRKVETVFHALYKQSITLNQKLLALPEGDATSHLIQLQLDSVNKKIKSAGDGYRSFVQNIGAILNEMEVLLSKSTHKNINIYLKNMIEYCNKCLHGQDLWDRETIDSYESQIYTNNSLVVLSRSDIYNIKPATPHKRIRNNVTFKAKPEFAQAS